MTVQIGAIVGVVFFLALAGMAFLWKRMSLFHWYCRRCRKVVSTGRFHPGKCPSCSTDALVAYFCRTCTSWNTASAPNWHCNDCSSKDVVLGVEYHLITSLWKWRNQAH